MQTLSCVTLAKNISFLEMRLFQLQVILSRKKITNIIKYSLKLLTGMHWVGVKATEAVTWHRYTTTSTVLTLPVFPRGLRPCIVFHKIRQTIPEKNTD